MKIVKKLTTAEVKQLIPSGALEAMASDEKDIIYCEWCDGMRRKDHICPLKPAIGGHDEQSMSE